MGHKLFKHFVRCLDPLAREFREPEDTDEKRHDQIVFGALRLSSIDDFWKAVSSLWVADHPFEAHELLLELFEDAGFFAHGAGRVGDDQVLP